MNIKYPFFSSIVFRTFSHPTEEKIFNFCLLEKGWNYGEGEKIPLLAIKSALNLHREIVYRGYSRTDAFPGLDGEIQITVYEGAHYFAFEREKSGKWSATHEKGEKSETLSGLNFEKIKEYLNSINSMLCNASDYYQGETIGTTRAEGSMTWRLSLNQMESPYSMQNVA